MERGGSWSSAAWTPFSKRKSSKQFRSHHCSTEPDRQEDHGPHRRKRERRLYIHGRLGRMWIYWTLTLILNLEAARIIAEGSGDTALEALSTYWRWPTGSEPRIIDKGVFPGRTL